MFAVVPGRAPDAPGNVVPQPTEETTTAGIALPHPESIVHEEHNPQEEIVPCDGLVQQLVALCSFLKELETQSHLIHLNYEGSNFIAVHGYLKAQYESHLEQFDTLSEHVRALDLWMPMCSNGLRESLPCFHHVQSHAGREMLATYYQNLEDLVVMIKTVRPTADAMCCFDIANYLDELMGNTNKASWFVKSTLRDC